MKQLPPFDEDHYNSQIEALFGRLVGRLERVKPLGRRTYVGDKKALFRRVKRVSMTLAILTALFAFVLAFYTPEEVVGSLTILSHVSACLGILGVAGAFIYIGMQASQRSPQLLNSILSSRGFALPLSAERAKKVAEWSKRNPRLLEVLAKWQVANPDNQLNDADFRVLEKSMRQISSIESERDRRKKLQTKERVRRVLVDSILSEAGIISAANKLRLEEVADSEKRDESSPSEQKPLI